MSLRVFQLSQDALQSYYVNLYLSIKYRLYLHPFLGQLTSNYKFYSTQLFTILLVIFSIVVGAGGGLSPCLLIAQSLPLHCQVFPDLLASRALKGFPAYQAVFFYILLYSVTFCISNWLLPFPMFINLYISIKFRLYLH